MRLENGYKCVKGVVDRLKARSSKQEIDIWEPDGYDWRGNKVYGPWKSNQQVEQGSVTIERLIKRVRED